jgi:mRNA interferase RelE/StbE
MYRVKLTPSVAETFNSLPPEVKKHIKASLKELYKTPHLGKSLQNELINLRSLKIKRYRAIYQIDDQNKTVIVYALGHRKDIYEVVAELVR